MAWPFESYIQFWPHLSEIVQINFENLNFKLPFLVASERKRNYQLKWIHRQSIWNGENIANYIPYAGIYHKNLLMTCFAIAILEAK